MEMLKDYSGIANTYIANYRNSDTSQNHFLQTFDARHVETAADMFECIKEHMDYATNGGNLRYGHAYF